MGADSAEARRAAGWRGAALDALGDGQPLSPRSLPPGGKIKPVGEEERGEGSTQSDAMLAALPSALGQHSPAILSPFKPPPACPPVEGGGLGAGALGADGKGLLAPPPPPLGVGLGEAGLPHSASLAGGMDALMLPLPPLEGLARPDSMANLHLMPLPELKLGGAPDSRNTSGMLGGG